MNGSRSDRLYELLPAVYRIRDARQGEPLRALLRVVEQELNAVEADIGGLYENWFIETCDEWVVPYIGELLGLRGLVSREASTFSQRAFVANTLRYRSRKGTAPVLEQLARDRSGWPARAVEFFERLVTCQNLNHLRFHSPRTPDLRDADRLELLTGPFGTAARTAEVRHVDNRRGKFNIPYVGLFLWRLQSYALTRTTARAAVAPPDGRYRFDALGRDVPLFNRPVTEEEISHLAEEINVPGRLRRRPLHRELAALRQSAAASAANERYFRLGDPVLAVHVEGERVPEEDLRICDLSDPPNPLPGGWKRPAAASSVAVDPVLGRLAFAAGRTPRRVEVSYAYGFSSDVGGGPYSRRESVDRALGLAPEGPKTWQVGVTRYGDTEPGAVVGSLAEAIELWNGQDPGTFGIISVMDSATYEEDLVGASTIRIPSASKLLLVAAGWPAVPDPEIPGAAARPWGRLEPMGIRPHLRGRLSVRGTSDGSERPGELVVNGFLIEGRLIVRVGDLGGLTVAHSTVSPFSSGILVSVSSADPNMRNRRLAVTLERVISGRIQFEGAAAGLRLVESVIDSGDATAGAGSAGPFGKLPFAVRAEETPAEVRSSTIFGRVRVRRLDGDSSIFTDRIEALRRQSGCLRFCWTAPRSTTPRRYRCQPDLEIARQLAVAERAAGHSLPPFREEEIRRRVRGSLVPSFTSTRYGDPAYAQLDLRAPEAVRTGGDGGSEMGVFQHLEQPQRESNLRISLDEYLRFGLEAGIFFVT